MLEAADRGSGSASGEVIVDPTSKESRASRKIAFSALTCWTSLYVLHVKYPKQRHSSKVKICKNYPFPMAVVY